MEEKERNLDGNLVRRALFKSPEYVDTLEEVKAFQGSLTSGYTAHHKLCENDSLPNWLSRNAIYNGGEIATNPNFRSHLFFGKDGAHCNITLRTHGRSKYVEADRGYHHTVLLESQPVNKRFPIEIKEALRDLEYEEIDPITEEFLESHRMDEDYGIENGIVVPREILPHSL